MLLAGLIAIKDAGRLTEGQNTGTREAEECGGSAHRNLQSVPGEQARGTTHSSQTVQKRGPDSRPALLYGCSAFRSALRNSIHLPNRNHMKAILWFVATHC